MLLKALVIVCLELRFFNPFPSVTSSLSPFSGGIGDISTISLSSVGRIGGKSTAFSSSPFSVESFDSSSFDFLLS